LRISSGFEVSQGNIRGQFGNLTLSSEYWGKVDHKYLNLSWFRQYKVGLFQIQIISATAALFSAGIAAGNDPAPMITRNSCYGKCQKETGVYDI
jgi:hypothetical protein